MGAVGREPVHTWDFGPAGEVAVDTTTAVAPDRVRQSHRYDAFVAPDAEPATPDTAPTWQPSFVHETVPTDGKGHIFAVGPTQRSHL